MYQLTIQLPKTCVEIFEQTFEDLALSTSSFEIDESEEKWEITMVLKENPSQELLAKHMGEVNRTTKTILPNPIIKPLETKDWVTENQKSFPILTIGPFMILGDHHKVTVPPGITTLTLNAGAAFGTGQHQTTSGCLEALDWTMRKHTPQNALDMGCGSAILAMAIAKRWNIQTIAADIDPVAIKVAQENIARHQLKGRIQCFTSNGYGHHRIKQNAPYDLIVANILAKPLCHMAKDASNHLSPKGILILSGLLTTQEQQVLQAYRQVGIHLLHRIHKNEWSTIILSRNNF